MCDIVSRGYSQEGPVGICRLLPQTLTPFLPPYLWLDQKFDTLFMSFAAGTVTLNIINVGLLVAVFLITVKK